MTEIPNMVWSWFDRALEDVTNENPENPTNRVLSRVNPDKLMEALEAMGLRITFDTKPAEEDAAFDGQYEAPRRELTAKERDVLCRILTDVMQPLRRPGLGIQPCGRTCDPSELPLLRGIRAAIDPRGGD